MSTTAAHRQAQAPDVTPAASILPGVAVRARLIGLRLVGFKSFAERTMVDFGPGINAVVGPNGSGKSNLADALRWALGEQGRSLRTRRAEDVIFAGSSLRRAIGMADVTLRIDNSDSLLPVDYREIELGRRLFRSGENEYLLNGQRIRLRDLVDLLYAANLADNALVFIGQGMVDQALALRPEERRPLFEEAAGIRRHERRRRRAEAELTEAMANLDRVQDLVAELRPQARRLAAQAEQQAVRHTAGTDLASALVDAARHRLGESSRTAHAERERLTSAHAAANAALRELRSTEEAVGALSDALAERSESERRARTALDAARERSLAARLADGRGLAELAALERDQTRVGEERTSVVTRSDGLRRVLAEPPVGDDPALSRALAEARTEEAAAAAAVEAHERSMADAGAEAEARRREDERHDAVLERARMRIAEATERHTAQVPRAADAIARAEAAAKVHRSAGSAARRSQELDAAAEARHQQVQADQERAAAGLAEEQARKTDLGARMEAARTALGALDARLYELTDERLGRFARARGGALVGEGLEVEGTLRACIDAALGEAITAFLLDEDDVAAVSPDLRGALVLAGRRRPTRPTDDARLASLAVAAGGGHLADAIRRDPSGAVTLLLSRTVWVPELTSALAMKKTLPPGWRVVTRDGVVVSDDGVVTLAAPSRPSLLALQDQRRSLVTTYEELTSMSAAAAPALEGAQRAVAAAQGALDASRSAQHAGRTASQVAAEAERIAGRLAEATAREAAWESAQLERWELDLLHAKDALGTVVAARAPGPSGTSAGIPEQSDGPASVLAGRLGALRQRSESLAIRYAAAEKQHEDWRESQRRADVGLAMDETRIAYLDGESARLVGASAEARQASARSTGELAVALGEEERLAAALEVLIDRSGRDRWGLSDAERHASAAREGLRLAESRSRTAEVAEMEARIGFDGAREQLLVELAGIGADGLGALAAAAGLTATISQPDPEELTATLEAALEVALAVWTKDQTTDRELPPTPARLGALRRRYHELGASNPFAAAEFADVRQRIETLDAQRADLESAIRSTRELIGDLDRLIAERFRTTFAALEGAFARRFHQLFDGGEAQLSLTDPGDLSATGVEITARPPGKKRQPLAMLSGGERALTAVALLMAMLEVRPVPFCVLDEVDAALDEANIGRFSQALRDLAEQIQFIVITHNRGTIEAADRLYGVTVDDEAVSKVISLRLEGSPGQLP